VPAGTELSSGSAASFFRTPFCGFFNAHIEHSMNVNWETALEGAVVTQSG
jgi:hypothetical protein